MILYPNDAFKTAEYLRSKFLLEYRIRVGIVIADSQLMPTRIGTVGVAIACSGFEPRKMKEGKRIYLAMF